MPIPAYGAQETSRLLVDVIHPSDAVDDRQYY